MQANLASKQADSAAAAKAKEAADLALTEAKKHLAILEALEEANEPSETPTTPSDNKPSETPTTPSEDEPSEIPADSGETETIVIPAGKTETKATGKKQAAPANPVQKTAPATSAVKDPAEASATLPQTGESQNKSAFLARIVALLASASLFAFGRRKKNEK